MSGRLPEALAVCADALQLNQDDPAWIFEQALCHLAGQQVRLAIEGFSHARDLAPERAEYWFGLGHAQQTAGTWPDAIRSFRGAIERDPDLAEAHLRLGRLLLNLGAREEAIESFRRVLQLSPGQLEAEALTVEALQELGREAETGQFLMRVDISEPAHAVDFGYRLQILGRFQEAEQAFRQALQLAPNSGAAYYGLARGRTMSEPDASLISQMEASSGDLRLPIFERVFLQYALGKSFEDLGEYRRAMQHYDEANGLEAISRSLVFDREQLIQYNDWRIRAYQPDLLGRSRLLGSDSEKPLFVIGMIRSGTTLIDQMLSAHSAISGAGELLFWAEKQEEFSRRISKASLSREFIRETGSEYLGLLDQIWPEASRVIDKMPLNFFLVGAIHMALPNARFIHVRREPVDNCLSIYTTYFDASPAFSHRHEDIVAYYREYERLMSHWRSVIPPERFIEVEYERVVESPEAEMRRLLEFCGVDWEEACLHPERNRRAVRTPSVWQVRQPIYQSSKERWKNFAPWLEEFSELLSGDKVPVR